MSDRRTGAAAAPPPVGELATDFQPRLVVLDIDGTLIDGNLVLHPRTRDAVRVAAARLPVILATGRMYRSALPWARELHVTEALVCYQGALVREQPQGDQPGAVLFEHAARREPAPERPRAVPPARASRSRRVWPRRSFG